MKKLALFFLAIASFGTAHAEDLTAKVYNTDNQTYIGEVTFKDTPYGLLIQPNFTSLTPGLHGFHLHQHPNCSDKGMGAGGHFDPGQTNTHLGPYAEGHLGDLPVLLVTADGKAITPTLAPRLKTSDLKEMAVMIHAGGDNYSDNPKLGGGGERIACGVIEKQS